MKTKPTFIALRLNTTQIALGADKTMLLLVLLEILFAYNRFEKSLPKVPVLERCNIKL